MKFVFVSSQRSDNSGCRAWLGFHLASAIQNTRHSKAEVIPVSKALKPGLFENSLCSSADIIIMEADPDPGVLAAIQHLKSLNKTVLLDIAPQNQIIDMNPASPTAAGWGNLPEKFANRINPEVQWQIRLVDAVIVHSPRMLEDVRGLAHGIVIPEFIELEKYISLGKLAHEGVVLGWSNQSFDPEAGINTGLLAALEHICQVRPAVRIEILGGEPPAKGSLQIPTSRVHYSPVPGDNSWPAPLSRIDIGLAPLSGELDQRRGWEDVLEFMAMKIPWVASQGPAYLELRPYGWIVENNIATWERVLLDVIDHLGAYCEEAEGEPYLFAISQGIEEKIESIINRFAEILDQHSPVRQ